MLGELHIALRDGLVWKWSSYSVLEKKFHYIKSMFVKVANGVSVRKRDGFSF
jgi:hypothetical protein